MNSSLQDRLAKLLPMLGSSHDGEVLSTVAAIRRCLDAAGLGFNDLPSLLASETKSFHAAPAAGAQGTFDLPPRWAQLGLNDKRAWLKALAACDWLTPYERERVTDSHRDFVVAPHRASLSWQRRKLFEQLIARAMAQGVRP
ncbi:hypothetical protein [Beijerinckia mobilis]|uniref:hypothetical protein n=1 Tax=Beijerinckia mobilis TaxID=231434 RepID=UPI0005560D68|nr:hypothetical protein [Beijerinckia mobilis]